MANVNLKDATKELVGEASGILEEATRIRKEADGLFDALKRLDSEMNRQAEEEAARRRQQEQLKAQSAHTKAFTMLDDDEKQMMEAARKEEAAKTAEPAVEKPAKKAEEPVKKPAEPAEAEKKPVETAAPEEKKPAKKVESYVATPDDPDPTRPAAPKKPAIGQIMSRPGDNQAPARPARPAGQPGQPGQYGRPAGQQGPYGRPAGQQGQYGRPAGQQGPYGRPAGQQGQYGRPAGQQGQYGRPAGQQGQYGRPAGGQQGGGTRPQGGFGNRQGGAGGSRQRTPELSVPMEKERVSNYDPNKKNYIRQHDPEHVSRNRKQASKNAHYNGYDDEVIRGGKRSRAKKPSAQQMMAPIKIETAYMAGDTITVRDLTEKIGKSASEIIKKLFLLGNMATINSEIDFDTAQLVCSDFEITLERKQEQTAEAALVAEDFDDEEENLQPRPPVVTIMGHVDHGKTSLLDYIRKSRVTAGEAGGITQHIGAYTVDVDGRKITFLDTPGHEAFTAMRARGTQATDIAVLVVAADDSVMPQTVESINHAKAAEVPVIVAINKMDKPDANPDRVKQDLTQYGLVCEDWGGETICVPVSAVTGQGVDELLEMILLQADMLQLQANPNRLGKGVIIEAKLDKARGPLATVLLQNGTLHVGDSVIAGLASGKVRALINDKGERVSEAGPSMPVEIMGFDDVPSAGDEMIAVGDDHLSRQVADERREKLKASREATMAKMSMENLFSSIEAGKVTTLNLIIKADVQGSVEAVKQAMEKLSNDEVKIRVLHSAAGAITKDDVNLASAFNAIIIGFNIRPDASAREAAEKQKVDVRMYTVIYKAIEDMELAMKGMLEPEYREVLLGHAEVRNVFKITGSGIIAGCYVTDGKVQRNAGVRLLRDNVVVFEGKLSSLRHLKDDVKEMAAGYECGMSLEGHNDIKEGDVVECYIMEEIPR
ncbi:translation initiation factor IF-2 [Aristaeella lactis]|uniref:Translation initiation factor IF-2 n=1 Tax=Aristaeella lactis TaxID=3046383 RepID=A0AC61PHZ8_9FIRM|nr:translation initiation factor IF-2 [Aristaeella lactis]QUA53622.1 translation initiation factor IF-2 [Aristaeella lactis]SMC37784.1 translation initiation factor IF-2 [Aristaeella lactis]